MKRTLHRLRRRGPLDRRVSIRAQYPWYMKAAVIIVVLAIGYGLAYWQFMAGHASISLAQGEAILAQLAVAERQLQVERATSSNVVKEMALLQDEIMQLKEDVAFYKGILAERGGVGAPQLQGVKIVKTPKPSEYRYEIGLAQTGSKAKTMRGTLYLTLQGLQDGKNVSRMIDLGEQQAGMMVSFKKYRQVDGVFSIPESMQAKSLLVEFLETGATRPGLSQTFNLPD
jgi:cell division protein FtsB